MAGTTTKGFRYPTASDAPAVHTAIFNLATDVDTKFDSYLTSVLISSTYLTQSNAAATYLTQSSYTSLAATAKRNAEDYATVSSFLVMS
jgi:hypothetical protein